MFGDFERILGILEEKGGGSHDIEKYKEMRFWRLKRDKSVREYSIPFHLAMTIR